MSLEKEFEDANRVIEFCDETPRHSRYLQDGATGTMLASDEVRSFTLLWSGAYVNCLFTVKENALELLRLEILETWKHLPT